MYEYITHCCTSQYNVHGHLELVMVGEIPSTLLEHTENRGGT